MIEIIKKILSLGDQVVKNGEQIIHSKVIAWAFVGAIGFLLLSIFIPVIQIGTWGVFFVVFGLWLLIMTDKYVFKDVDTLKEIIQNRNMAYAMVWIAIAVVIGLALIAFSNIYKTLGS